MFAPTWNTGSKQASRAVGAGAEEKNKKQKNKKPKMYAEACANHETHLWCTSVLQHGVLPLHVRAKRMCRNMTKPRHFVY